MATTTNTPTTYEAARKAYDRCLRAELKITNGPLTNSRSLAAARRATERTNAAIRVMAAIEGAS